MRKIHCDACDAVLENNLQPKSALVSIPGWSGNVSIEARSARDNSQPELCRRCEVMVAHRFIEDMERTLRND